MNWSARVFFFVLLGFIVYIFVAGDSAKWHAVFTQKLT